MSWLLDSDPSIRWQVLRDLQPGESAEAIAAERSRIATEGWGARLLALQSPQGYWGGSDDEGWMTTMHTLVLLKNMGLDPACEAAQQMIGRVREHITWFQLDGRPFFEGETEPCINGGILAAGAYFGQAVDAVAERLLSEQLNDGGWNCKAPPSMRTSFHTTICVLEGLLAYEHSGGAKPALKRRVKKARLRAQGYLLERRLHKSLSTGEVIDKRWLRFAFPPTWHYDLLRGLDYLRSAGVAPDERMAEAITVVEERAHQNRRWPLNVLHGEHLSFELEPGVGRASHWNTLRAMRVLEWYRR